MGIIAPKLQIFTTRAISMRQHLTLPLAVWNPILLDTGWKEEELSNCLLLQDILKDNECTNSMGKKEPSVRWLRVGIENSNNFSLKKSTLDTRLIRTYKQTELLCTHINKCHSMWLWLSPCRAPSSHMHLHRTQQVSEPWDLSALGLSHLACLGQMRAREKVQFRPGLGCTWP